jgi:hypothetical protein
VLKAFPRGPNKTSNFVSRSVSAKKYRGRFNLYAFERLIHKAKVYLQIEHDLMLIIRVSVGAIVAGQ